MIGKQRHRFPNFLVFSVLTLNSSGLSCYTTAGTDSVGDPSTFSLTDRDQLLFCFSSDRPFLSLFTFA